MTNGEKIIAILKPRKDQIRIYGNWVEIEIQKLGINFSCELDWWNAEYKEPTIKNNLGVDCISRKQAIDAFPDLLPNTGYNKKAITEILQEVPSVTLQESVIHDNKVKDELESITKDLVPRKVVEHIIKSPRTQEQMLSMLNSIPSVISQDPRWVSVSERLPEKNIACLVKVGKFNLTKMAMYSDLMGTINHKIFYQGDVGHDNFEDITEYVKAWMPLPQSYNEVEE